MIVQLTVGPSRAGQKNTLLTKLGTLKDSQAYTVEIKEYRRPKTHPQLRFVWGLVYPMIIANADKPKPDAETLNFYWLGECFGWEVMELNGAAIERKPLRRLSDLNTLEIGQYWAFIQRRMAETRGLYIPDPQHIDKNEADYE